MGTLADIQIDTGAIVLPWASTNQRPGAPSFGVSIHGYNLRIDPQYGTFTKQKYATVKPGHFAARSLLAYAHDGVVQIIPLRSEHVCSVSYAYKRGQNQDQAGLNLPKID